MLNISTLSTLIVHSMFFEHQQNSEFCWEEFNLLMAYKHLCWLYFSSYDHEIYIEYVWNVPLTDKHLYAKKYLFLHSGFYGNIENSWTFCFVAMVTHFKDLYLFIKVSIFKVHLFCNMIILVLWMYHVKHSHFELIQ